MPYSTILPRYTELVPLNGAPGQWAVQERYGKEWWTMKRPLRPSDLKAMLAGRKWLGTRAPADGLIDRILIDIDAKGPGELQRRTETYRRLRHLMGGASVPLVWATPSGGGLRVAYRIEPAPVAEVVGDGHSGVVPDVLRAAGLDPADGVLEVYPRSNHVDRLILGARMPLLDSETLLPLFNPTAFAGDRLAELQTGLEVVAAWHGRGDAGLLGRIRRLPRRDRREGGDAGHASRARVELTARPAREPEAVPAWARRCAEKGLPRRSSRYETEFTVGVAMVLHPGAFREYGLADDAPSDEAIANALATWLSLRHNGLSNEWNRSVRRYGSTSAARAWWVRRYLARGGRDGRHFVDRLRAAAVHRDPGSRFVALIAPEEREGLMRLAECAGFRGAQRYRAECWLVALWRALKLFVLRHQLRGTPCRTRTIDARLHYLIEYCARWMEALPFGKGGQTRYAQYRDVLLREGWMRLAVKAPTRVNMAARDGTHRVANQYLVVAPSLTVRVRDVGVDPEKLRRAARRAGSTYGRRLSLDEAQHCLFLVRSGIDLLQRYGRRTAVTVRRIAAELEEQLLAIAASERDSRVCPRTPVVETAAPEQPTRLARLLLAGARRWASRRIAWLQRGWRVALQAWAWRARRSGAASRADAPHRVGAAGRPTLEGMAV